MRRPRWRFFVKEVCVFVRPTCRRVVFCSCKPRTSLSIEHLTEQHLVHPVHAITASTSATSIHVSELAKQLTTLHNVIRKTTTRIFIIIFPTLQIFRPTLGQAVDIQGHTKNLPCFSVHCCTVYDESEPPSLPPWSRTTSSSSLNEIASWTDALSFFTCHCALTSLSSAITARCRAFNMV